MVPKYSIIIPIYNIEKYIEVCIESILKQNFKNIEVILVNDGSKDSSGTICDFYCKKDKRITVIHTKNKGVSSARNIGIEKAKGDWVLFLDGDDTLEDNILSWTDSYIKSNDSVDMILGSFKYIYKNNNIVLADNEDRVDKGINIIKYYGKWEVKICMGSFIVKNNIIKNNSLKYNLDTKYGEDVEFISYCLMNSKTVKITKQYFFNYKINSNSAIAKVNFERYDCYKARKRTLEYIKENYSSRNDLIELYENYLLPEAIIDTTYLLCRSHISILKIIKFLKENKYYLILIDMKENNEIEFNIKNKINKFIKSPIKVWIKLNYLGFYYNSRGYLGMLKRRLSS